MNHNFLFHDDIDPSNGLYIADTFGRAPVLENVGQSNQVAVSTTSGVNVDDTLIAARRLGATRNHDYNLYMQSVQTLSMNAPQNSVPRTPVGTQHYGEVASRAPPPELCEPPLTTSAGVAHAFMVTSICDVWSKSSKTRFDVMG